MTDNFDASQTAPACQQGALVTEADLDLDALVAAMARLADDMEKYATAEWDEHENVRLAVAALTALTALRAERDAMAADIANLTASLAGEVEARVVELSKVNAVWQTNCRETFEAMCAMRDSINEHIQMPSLESDLLQGPETSVFCATVAEAVIGRVSAAEARALAAEAAALERAVVACKGMAEQVSDAALTGLPEQSRMRESMEAAFTKARHVIRALITPEGRTALDAALADARKAGKLEGLREAAQICDRNDQVSGWVSRDAILALAASQPAQPVAVKVKRMGWWCDPCRSVGMMHCSDPENCGFMRTASAKADDWKSWLDDLPLPDDFSQGIDMLQDFITHIMAAIDVQHLTVQDAARVPEIAALIEKSEALRDDVTGRVDAFGDRIGIAQPMIGFGAKQWADFVAALRAIAEGE